MTEEDQILDRAYYKYMASLSPEDRVALLESILPSRTPFFKPADREPDFSEWQTSDRSKNSEENT